MIWGLSAQIQMLVIEPQFIFSDAVIFVKWKLNTVIVPQMNRLKTNWHS